MVFSTFRCVVAGPVQKYKIAEKFKIEFGKARSTIEELIGFLVLQDSKLVFLRSADSGVNNCAAHLF